ncbi:alpha/beta fold hydrolase [Pyxidicoccus sp. 3LG]
MRKSLAVLLPLVLAAPGGLAAPATPAPSGPAKVAKDPRRVRYGTVEVDGLRIFYREAGNPSAPTLLLLHGFPSSSHMFRDLMPLLADRFHLVAPDYPGFGNSDAPPPDTFQYDFDHLTDVVEKFVQKKGLTRFALYMQDYGGPVGFRLATRHPDWISGLVIQNANAYVEGLTPVTDQTLRPLWEKRNSATEAPARKMLEREGTLFQYHAGARNPAAMNPDAWNMDQQGLDRPGNAAIQVELLANYHTNLARYPEWHAYFRQHQPPTLVVWGKGDPIFGVPGAHAYKKDLKNLEVHLLDTGHFALEEEAPAIAEHIAAFMSAKVVRKVR